jgi:NADPH:quinone reductase-like Zn-dependent oxidoreductase
MMRSPFRALLGGALLTCLASAWGGAAAAATPGVQKAIVQVGNGGPEVLQLRTVPVLQPGPEQVLIKVYAASINPVDWKNRIGTGAYAPAPGAPREVIPGGDVAGVVAVLGAGVTGLKVGDPVFALIPRLPSLLNGGYSEYVLAPANTTALKPGNITYLEAAGLGIATVTGVRAVNATGVAKGQRVLITGAAGGVGSAAVQTAKARGAYVIGTASPRSHAYLRSLGIDELVDYTKVKFEDAVKNVDVVIDTVGEDTAERAFASLKKGGNYVSVAARGIEGKCAAAGAICAPRGSSTDTNKALFEETAALVAAGKIKVNIDKRFALAQAGQAQSYSEAGRTQGKIGLVVNAAEADKK